MTRGQQEAVLEAWHESPTTTADQIAAALGVTRNQVLGHVHRARQAGDPRAVRRGIGSSASAALSRRLDRLERELAAVRAAMALPPTLEIGGGRP